ncbi:MAG: glycoside hydrolase family 19 protein [Sphingomonas sp.]|nr:glycoside hydrolase family 19 protein [Sphingomonas sp.]
MAIDVTQLQQRLKARGYPIGIDGDLGGETFAALLAAVAGAKPGAAVLTRMRRDIGAALARHLPGVGVDRPLRLAHFLAQANVETGGFRVLVESLNYVPEALIATFNKSSIRIKPADAQRLGRKPGEGALSLARQEEIANLVYGGAFGKSQLGNDQPGDGWRFRGRGIKQTTGRFNYGQFKKVTGLDVVADPDLLGDPDTGVNAGCVFWAAKQCNLIADRDDIDAMTLTINGGTNGLADRKAALGRAKAILL